METPALEEFDAFWSPRGHEDWTSAVESERRIAAYRATDTIYATYAVDGHESSNKVKMAIFLLAPEMLTKNVQVAAPAQAVVQEEMKAGSYEEKTVFTKPGDDPYPLITKLLYPILPRTAGDSRSTLKIVRMVRA